MVKKNISMVGAGKMSSILTRYFVNAGYRVYIGNRETEEARLLAEKVGVGAKGGSIEEAIQHGEIVFLAVPYLQIQETIKLTGPLSGKVVVDISNPLKPDLSGLLIGGDTSAAEELAKLLPEAKIVKAFNCVFATILERGLDYEQNCSPVFYAGDDESARKEVEELIKVAGFNPVDTGPLFSARYLEPLSALVIQIDNGLKGGFSNNTAHADAFKCYAINNY